MPGDQPFPLDTHALLEALGDAVIVADDDGIVRFANRALLTVLGQEPAGLVGQPLINIVPPSLRHAHRAGFARYLSTRVPSIVGGSAVRVPALRGDGTEVEIELALTAHTDAESGRQLFVASLRDLTERMALERERQRTHYLNAMREVMPRIATLGTESVSEAGTEVLGTVAPTLACQIGAVWVPLDGALRVGATWCEPEWSAALADLAPPEVRFEPGGGVIGQVFESMLPMWVEDIAATEDFLRRPQAIRHGLRSCLAFPVIASGQVAAVIEMFSVDVSHPDAGLLGVLATTGAELGRLLDRVSADRREREATAHLVELAEALQASLLPPTDPQVPGLDVALRYRAASGEGHVGGDFVDVFALADGGWALAVGDVSGRGARAATLAALARYTLRAAAATSVDPASSLRVVNDVIVAELDRLDEFGERFLTIAFLIAVPARDGLEIRTACGGHPPPHIRRANGTVEPIACAGDLLGSFPVFEASGETHTLHPGDSIVIVTDGVLEARTDGEEFGTPRLAAALASAQGTADDIADAITACVAAFAPEGIDDDVAVAVLRVPSADTAAMATPGASPGQPGVSQ